MKILPATLLSVALAHRNGAHSDSVTMDRAEIKAIEKDDENNSASPYNLHVKYGPSELRWLGHYAYIWFELSGAMIEDGTVVQSYAKIYDTDYEIPDYLDNEKYVHKANDGEFEMAECSVEFNSKNTGPVDIAVKTYQGETNVQGIEEVSNEITVWRARKDIPELYEQAQGDDIEDDESYATCFMERKPDDFYASFHLKNYTLFKVKVGYNLYDAEDYQLQKDSYLTS